MNRTTLNKICLYALQLFCGIYVLFLPIVGVGQSYPNRPITLVVPFTPGGGTDFMARVYADQLTKLLGQPVLVDNRPGAGGTLGTDFVARSEPNGYTLLMGSVSTIAINPSMYKKMASNPLKDLSPISLAASTPSIIAVPASLKVNNLQELIALAKSKPGSINFGSAGVGTSHHLAGELLKSQSNIEITHVPYKGSSPALTGLIRGDVQILIANIPSLAGAIEAKQIKAIAVTSEKRTSLLPDVPTAIESGLKGFTINVWYAIFAPINTPNNVIQKLNQTIHTISGLPEIKQRLIIEGAEAISSSSQDLRQLMDSDFNKWSEIIKKSNATME
jgi:tripartite-type tricarboxylate transporter receptor subunit TctC